MPENAISKILVYPTAAPESWPADDVQYIRLFWSISREGTLQVAEKLISAHPDCVFIFQAGVPMIIPHASEPGWLVFLDSLTWVHFFKSQPGAGKQELLKVLDTPVIIGLSMDYLLLFNRLAYNLLWEQETGSPVTLRRHYIMIILAHLTFTYGLSQHIEVPGSADSLIAKLYDLIELHAALQRRPAFYASALGIPERKLNRVSRTVSGKSVLDLIHTRLITEAERLLRDTSLMIKEIAYTLGFAGPDTFTHFFRRHQGVRPGEFRMRVQDLSNDHVISNNFLKS